MKGILVLCVVLSFSTLLAAGKPVDRAKVIAALIAPEKLATLKQRGANPRVQKYVAQLALVKLENGFPEEVVIEAVKLAGMDGEAAEITRDAMLRNLKIAESLGCTDEAGLADMKRGQSPTVKRGPYKGDQLSVDHIIPRSVVQELDNVVANLELMPLRMNERKSADIGDRQIDLAKKLSKAGLLSEDGFRTVLNTPRKQSRVPVKNTIK